MSQGEKEKPRQMGQRIRTQVLEAVHPSVDPCNIVRFPIGQSRHLDQCRTKEKNQALLPTPLVTNQGKHQNIIVQL